MTRLKLLSKQEIDQAKARDRQRDIDEGLKLAKRVDTLREIQADEEQSLQKFREQTLSELDHDLKEKEVELKTIIADIDKCRRERAELLIPLDAEWERVQAQRNANEELRRELDNHDATLRGREYDLGEQSKLVSSLLDDARRRSDSAARLHADAGRDRADAQHVMEKAQAVREDTLRYKEQVDNDLRIRDAAIATRERELEVRIEWVDKREHSLDDREIQLKDREETLARNLERYGRQRR